MSNSIWQVSLTFDNEGLMSGFRIQPYNRGIDATFIGTKESCERFVSNMAKVSEDSVNYLKQLT